MIHRNNIFTEQIIVSKPIEIKKNQENEGGICGFYGVFFHKKEKHKIEHESHGEIQKKGACQTGQSYDIDIIAVMKQRWIDCQ